MVQHLDTPLADAFTSKCEQARSELASHMKDRGLHLEEGWRIHEQVRHIDGRTEIVMTPIHIKHPAPEGLECSCSIDEEGSNASSRCDGGKDPY